jgi:hypothetical protein
VVIDESRGKGSGEGEDEKAEAREQRKREQVLSLVSISPIKHCRAKKIMLLMVLHMGGS